MYDFYVEGNNLNKDISAGLNIFSDGKKDDVFPKPTDFDL